MSSSHSRPGPSGHGRRVVNPHGEETVLDAELGRCDGPLRRTPVFLTLGYERRSSSATRYPSYTSQFLRIPAA